MGKEFSAQIQVLDIPNEIKVGYSPIGFVRCGRAACRISALKWKMGKETGGKKLEDPHSLKSNEMAQCSFQPQQPLVCDTFKNCEGLSRVAFMDGNGVVMLGKVISCERKEEGDKEAKRSRHLFWQQFTNNFDMCGFLVPSADVALRVCLLADVKWRIITFKADELLWKVMQRK